MRANSTLVARLGAAAWAAAVPATAATFGLIACCCRQFLLARPEGLKFDLSAPRLPMPLFWKHYKSDVTSFIEQLKAQRPTLEEEQKAGRALLWDKRVDREAQAENRDSRISQQPYVYQPKTP